MTTTMPLTEQEKLDRLNTQLERVIEHQRTGRLPQAQELNDALIAEYGELPRLWHQKAMIRFQQGDPDAALKMLEEVLSLQPEDSLVRVDHGSILAQTGRMDEALDQFEQAAATSPNFALAHANLGAGLVLKEKYAEAVAHLKRAIELDGSVLDVHTNLAQAYIRTERWQDAIDVLYRAASVDPRSCAVHIGLATALARFERFDAAEHHARRALEIDPDSGEALFHLGAILASTGRMGASVESLIAAMDKGAMALQAAIRLIHMRKTTRDSPEFKALQSVLPSIAAMPEEGRPLVHFGAAKAFDDLGDYGTAFEHLKTANDLTAKTVPFDRDRFVAQFERLRALSTPALIAAAAGGGLDTAAPIFICGMPRSGTTLIEQMFSRHPKVQSGGELLASHRAFARSERLKSALEGEIGPGDLVADDFTQLAEHYLSVVRDAGIKSRVFTDKLPINYRYAPLLSLAMPRAKFIVMRRHPLDCLLSNYMQNFGRNQPSTNSLPNLAMTYRQFDTTVRQYAELLEGKLVEMQYEEVVARSETSLRAAVAFVGLEWADAVLDHTASSQAVNTASVAQVRKPIYSSSVGRWRAYAPFLTDLAQDLRDYLSDEELAACGVAPAPA